MPFKKKTSTHRLGLAFRLPQMQRKGESTASRQRGRKFWEMESSEERVGVPTQVRPDFRNTGPGPVPAHLTHQAGARLFSQSGRCWAFYYLFGL